MSLSLLSFPAGLVVISAGSGQSSQCNETPRGILTLDNAISVQDDNKLLIKAKEHRQGYTSKTRCRTAVRPKHALRCYLWNRLQCNVRNATQGPLLNAGS
jgi:hypothetical protein